MNPRTQLKSTLNDSPLLSNTNPFDDGHSPPDVNLTINQIHMISNKIQSNRIVKTCTIDFWLSSKSKIDIVPYEIKIPTELIIIKYIINIKAFLFMIYFKFQDYTFSDQKKIQFSALLQSIYTNWNTSATSEERILGSKIRIKLKNDEPTNRTEEYFEWFFFIRWQKFIWCPPDVNMTYIRQRLDHSKEDTVLQWVPATQEHWVHWSRTSPALLHFFS